MDIKVGDKVHCPSGFGKVTDVDEQGAVVAVGGNRIHYKFSDLRKEKMKLSISQLHEKISKERSGRISILFEKVQKESVMVAYDALSPAERKKVLKNSDCKDEDSSKLFEDLPIICQRKVQSLYVQNAGNFSAIKVHEGEKQ